MEEKKEEVVEEEKVKEQCSTREKDKEPATEGNNTGIPAEIISNVVVENNKNEVDTKPEVKKIEIPEEKKVELPQIDQIPQ